MDKGDINIGVTIKGTDDSVAAFKSVTKNAQNLNKNINAANQSIHSMSNASRTSTRQMRAHFSQLGYQVQDISVQLQGGQNALMVLGQQGSQIASVFGMWGSLAGAGIAAVAAIIYGMTKDTDNAKSAVDRYTESLEMLDSVTEKAGNGQTVLSEKIAKTARVSAAAARVQLTVAQRAYRDMQTAAAQQIKEIFNDSDINTFGLSEVFDDLMSNSLKATLGQAKFMDEIGAIANRAGVSAYDLEGFLVSYRDLLMAPTPQGFKDLADALSQMALDTGDSQLQNIANKVNELAVDVVAAKPGVDELTKSLTDLDGALNRRETANADSKGKKGSKKSYSGTTTSDSDWLKAQTQSARDYFEVLRILDPAQAQFNDTVEKLDNALAINHITQTEYTQGWQKAAKTLEDARKKMDDMQDPIKDMQKSMEDAFASIIDGSQSAGDAFRTMIRSMIMEWMKAAVIKPFVSSLFSSFLPGRASGGPISAGQPYMVGERGPEMIVPSQSGMVIPNHALGGSGGGSSNVVVNVIEDSSRAGQTEQRNEGGKTIIDVMVDTVKKSLISDIGQGGEFNRAMSRQYGLSRAAGI